MRTAGRGLPHTAGSYHKAQELLAPRQRWVCQSARAAIQSTTDRGLINPRIDPLTVQRLED